MSMRPDKVTKIIGDIPYMTLEQEKRITEFIGQNNYMGGTPYFKIKTNCRGAVDKAARYSFAA